MRCVECGCRMLVEERVKRVALCAPSRAWSEEKKSVGDGERGSRRNGESACTRVRVRKGEEHDRSSWVLIAAHPCGCCGNSI
jgi:hypothetical protein